MRLQLLSDLHLETESFDPQPAPQADLLVLAGDIDSTWKGYERFAHWPVPVVVVAGNHEFDGREVGAALAGLRGLCDDLGLRLLECESWIFAAASGLRVRLLGTVRWSDFDLLGPQQRARAERAAAYFLRGMDSRVDDQPLDAAAVRAWALRCRDWLRLALAQPSAGRWDRTVVITHFGPSLRSADPRYGHQPGTASFCNADDALIPQSDLWLHGHLHCRHDYTVPRPGLPDARVVSNARGLAGKAEDLGHDPLLTVEV